MTQNTPDMKPTTGATQSGSTPKKSYSTPTLTVHGSIEKLTQGSPSIGSVDSIFTNFKLPVS